MHALFVSCVLSGALGGSSIDSTTAPVVLELARPHRRLAGCGRTGKAALMNSFGLRDILRQQVAVLGGDIRVATTVSTFHEAGLVRPARKLQEGVQDGIRDAQLQSYLHDTQSQVGETVRHVESHADGEDAQAGTGQPASGMYGSGVVPGPGGRRLQLRRLADFGGDSLARDVTTDLDRAKSSVAVSSLIAAAARGDRDVRTATTSTRTAWQDTVSNQGQPGRDADSLRLSGRHLL